MSTLRHLSLLLCAWAASASALAQTPDWVKELGPTKPGDHPPLPASEMEFSLSWKGMLNSGKLGFKIGEPGDHKPGVIVIESTGKSMGAGGSIFPYRGHGWSEINVRSLRPRYLTATEFKRGKKIETENRFFSNRVAFREITTEEKEREIKSHVFSENPVYDIGSAILFIRSQDLDDGDEIKLMLHPYSSPYLLQAKVIGREKRNGTPCIKMSLELHKISVETLKLKPYKKLKEPALLWFSDDPQRLPMEVRSKVFIGDIRAYLENYKKA